MPQEYRQIAGVINVVKSILDNYPITHGPFRELIPNAEDAGATRQVFVLDRRTHPTNALYHDDYKEHQRAISLIAYNDAYFEEKDWISLQRIFESSKTGDASAIGQYGQGFRCVYHLTDCPQILSGTSLALLHLLGQGVKLDLTKPEDSRYDSHLAAFSHLPGIPSPAPISEENSAPHFPGTAIRLPLRLMASQISDKLFSAADVLQLIQDFIKNDLDVVLLFLKNVKTLEFWEIMPSGESRNICVVEMKSDPQKTWRQTSQYESYRAVVDVRVASPSGTLPTKEVATKTFTTISTTWRILHCDFTDPQSLDILRGLMPHPDVLKEMERKKLGHAVTLAAPISRIGAPISFREGRLFNGLPLPTQTRLPLHVNARFAIMSSRQHLRNTSTSVGASLEDRWNPILFETFIPQAWTFLLSVLARADASTIIDIFRYWPTEMPSNQDWKNLLQRIFQCVVVAKSHIWPIYPCPSTKDQLYTELSCIKIALEEQHFADLRTALAECGVHFTMPPIYIRKLIDDWNMNANNVPKFEFLTPANVHPQLLANLTKMRELVRGTTQHTKAILSFLLSTEDVEYLSGLPLLANTGGDFVELQRLQASHEGIVHALFDRQSHQLFASADPNGIVLYLLPPQVVKVLKTKAPSVLNVKEPDAKMVKHYLEQNPKWTGEDEARHLDDTSSIWLQKFWQWLYTFSHRDELFSQIHHLYLVPTQSGLRCSNQPIFDTASVMLAKCLKALNVSLIEPAFARVIHNFKIIKDVKDVKAVIHAASPSPTEHLAVSEWKVFIEHVSKYGHAADMTEVECRKLRSLPLFPLLDPSSFTSHHTNSTTTPAISNPAIRSGAIPEGKIVMGITSSAALDILPVISGRVSLDLRNTNPDILRFVQPSEYQPLSITNLLELGVQNFPSQPPEIRTRIVAYMADDIQTRKGTVQLNILTLLSQQPFLVAQDGSLRTPKDTVDPDSDIGDVFSHFPHWMPRMESQAEKDILEQLRKLQPHSPLRRTMDKDMFLEVTGYISTRGENVATREEAIVTSRKLLKLLAKMPQYSELVKEIPREHRWIVTNLGLKGTRECRDRNAQSALFDEVLPLLEDNIPMTDMLRGVFGWNSKLHHQVLFGQLDSTLKKRAPYKKVREIVKEIGQYELTEEDVMDLKKVLGGRDWVPTKEQILVKPANAVFTNPIHSADLLEVSFNDVDHPQVLAFLKRMGCEESPTVGAILSRLQGLSHGQLRDDQVSTAIQLLELLPSELEEGIRVEVRIPDANNIMRQSSELYFNGNNQHLSKHLRGEKAIAHPHISEHLARKFRLEHIASKLSNFGSMGIRFITTVQNVIKDYSETQMLTELLANAVDAGGKRFVLVVDEFCTKGNHLISENLAVFHKCPALLVYNDSKFTESDFIALNDSGRGNKAGRSGAIGQFGLGVLTMFHVTELPLIISGGYAVFIDPSQSHLLDLPEGAHNQRIDIGDLQRYYPGHLDFTTNIDHVLRIDTNDITSFSGTLFRLPLRQHEHISNNSPVSNATWTTQELQERLLHKFKEIARNCFLFTGLGEIQVYHRAANGRMTELWSITAIPSPLNTDGLFQKQMIEVHERKASQVDPPEEDPEKRTLWQVVLSSDPTIPDWVLELLRSQRIKRPKAALAAIILPEDAQYEDYHKEGPLFSTMPLTFKTRLPVFCSSTFILTSDRRHIRLDNDPHNQSRYNEWLLREVVPPLYLCLLEELLTIAGVNDFFWPINESDPIASIIIKALYEIHLNDTTRRVFRSAFRNDLYLTPNDVVILEDPSDLTDIIRFLAPENIIQYAEPLLSRLTDDAQLRILSPGFLRQEISKDPARFTQAFTPLDNTEPRFSFEVLQVVLEFLLKDGPENAFGLQLLPLHDGSFTTIESSIAMHPTMFYVWTYDLLPDRVFVNPARLVDFNFNANILLGKGLNVEELTSASLALLIAEEFNPAEQIDISGDRQQMNWISEFWTQFPLLRMKVADILGFPLVPTIRYGHYVSLNLCKTDRVLLCPNFVDERACSSLSHLGVTVVCLDPGSCPPPLLHILGDSNGFPVFQAIDVLRALSHIEGTIVTARFNSLNAGQKEFFARWIRPYLNYPPPDLVSVARNLPVWSGYSRSGPSQYLSASDLKMLPRDLDINIASRYMSQIVAPFSEDLCKLDIPVLSPQELFAMILPNLPPAMISTEELQAYRILVEWMLLHMKIEEISRLRVPDRFHQLRPACDLYARDDLFLSAFGEGSHHFICPEYQDLEESLTPPLKQRRDLDMDMFVACAQAVANNSDEEAALILIRDFNSLLPFQMATLGQEADEWEKIDDIEFIPVHPGPLWRPHETENIGLDVSQYALQLGEMVSPRQVVRSEFTRIAWSQRAIAAVEFSEGLIRAYPAIGQPTIEEVVKHLRTLALEVVRDHPNTRAIVHDIKATYQWLNGREEDAREFLELLMDEPLFLNVDDPFSTTPWQWESASKLSLDVRDVGTLKALRRFLQDYRPLLLAAGAQDVKLSLPRNNSPAISDVDRMMRVRRKYNQMRKEWKLVDVRFVIEDEIEGEPLLAHRSFLATFSDHLETAFLSDEGQHASPADPITITLSEYSRDCVELVLDYVYTGEIADPTTVEVLLEGLKLAKYWDMNDLFEALQDHIIYNALVYPATIDQIQRLAEVQSAARLLLHCQQYRHDNAAYITRSQN